MTMSPISLQRWQTSASRMQFEGLDIACWSAGEGRPLLLVHGFPTAAWDWSWIWDRLATRRRVIACDMLGFGFSAKPRAGYSLLRQADLQQALLAQHGVDDCDAVVHDYGVSVGQELLARQNEGRLPFRMGRIAFLNGGLFPALHRPRLIQQLGAGPLGPLVGALLSERRFGRSLAAVFGADTQPGAEELAAFWRLLTFNNGHRRLHPLLGYMRERRQHRQRWEDALRQARIPLTLINGGADPVSGAHLYAHWRGLLPQAGGVLLPSIGHYPQCEAPEEVLRALLAFLA
jgi:pimeloyl-ACP methyl ester carboxylesterase